MGQFSICKLKWDLLRTSVTACTFDENTFSAPFENGNLKRNFTREFVYKPLMGCSLFSNSHFQMGITVMGFAEHFGQGLKEIDSSCIYPFFSDWIWIFIRNFSVMSRRKSHQAPFISNVSKANLTLKCAKWRVTIFSTAMHASKGCRLSGISRTSILL